MKLISFGKKFENMLTSVEHSTLGSEFRTFSKKIQNGDKIVFVCGSQMWGVAKVSSEVTHDTTPFWKDKLYPYRAKIVGIELFRSPLTFSTSGVDQIFRDTLGRQWAYKILFTPGELPTEAVIALNYLFRSAKFLEPAEYGDFLHLHLREFELAKRKRLGLL